MALSEILSVSATGFIVVLIVLIALAFIIVGISKVIRTFEGGTKKAEKTEAPAPKKEAKPVPTAVSTPAATVAPAQQYDGLMLYKTDYKTAASIMAIVSYESGIPLNRLSFSSIKLDDSLELYKTDYKTAASIMAIVSHQTEIPLQRLVFKSIRLCDTPELYKTDEETAAKVMAITSKESGIPLDRLVFKSIKLIEK